MLRALRRTPLAALCSVALVAACSKGDSNADSARLADSAAAAATAAAPAPAAPVAPAMSDANILAKLDADNVHDSTGGSMAVAMGTNAGVKDFGRMMMKDHHAMRVEGMALAKKLSITPELPAGDNMMADAKASEDAMKAMAKGAAWDKAYVDANVTDHEKTLRMAQDAANATQNAELKAMIEKATPTVQKHLDAAKALQSKMGGMAGADTAMKH